MSVDLPILCFNDVYRVNQRYVSQPGAPSVSSKTDGHISVSQFGHLLLDQRAEWADRSNSSSSTETREKDGLVVFAGDVFNPSTESSVTRGSHMVPIMNALGIDCACVGNHDFDFGYPHLTKLISSTSFPWLLSNIVDDKTGNTPAPLQKYWVTERCGVKIGIIGLVEQDWIATIPSWPDSFKYKPMKDVALELSTELRDPKGQHKVEVIIALTHCRVPNDIALANELGAVHGPDSSRHGVDLLIGGHDHVSFYKKWAKSWEGYSGDHEAPGTEKDKGVMLIKSGTDFRDLSSATLSLSPPTNSIRRRTIMSLTGVHHYVLPVSPSSPSIDALLKNLLSSVSSTLSKSVCFTLTPFDARSEMVRTRETGLGNWAADVLLHAYAESMIEGVEEGADAVIICGGTLRGDSQYGPGKITMGDILEIFPFEDPVVCIEIDGKGIWDTLESALSKWPAQEGRFPIISGLVVKWDHTLPPYQRVKSIHLSAAAQKEDLDDPDDLVDFVDQEDGTRIEVKQRPPEVGEEVKNEEGGRMYKVITREYMAQGYDGFTALKNRRTLIDDESGLIISSIIRSFLLGSSYIFRHKQLVASHTAHLSTRTKPIISKARQSLLSPSSSPDCSPRNSHLSSSPNFPQNNSWVSPSSLQPFGILSSTNSQSQTPGSPGRLSLVAPRSPPRERGNPLESPGIFRKNFIEPPSPMDVRLESMGFGFGFGSGGEGKKHVISHSWSAIRDAMFISRHEHLSDVDCLEGDKMRAQHTSSSQQNESKTMDIPGATNEALGVMEDELAIVCPLIDGRLKDVAVEEL
ncbi:hypothetical protein M231_03932 [Tremella mesenterica]|uniref:5'-Nucleotidase C-terminal domain-containing protein n=1 Tax=Tremella mesenterica TaxID=5217 RepID=A0A4Q1BLU2_TREME|nr:hypothetical protein M231_03932 [Tremella mesenterica]